ncbi:MAG: hypothetical protein CMJ78_07565 [Planctomycetaceae bacterium]|nr:hypothetical protein [Planctomycetaceae bacterium]
MAPTPVWFNEGIATGFEGDGVKVKSGPSQISKRYARLSLSARVVDWREIVRNDRAFRGDIFAGEAYGHAWGLHWMLANKYKTKYIKYIQALSKKETLGKVSFEDRLTELESIVGKGIDELQREFQKELVGRLQRR